MWCHSCSDWLSALLTPNVLFCPLSAFSCSKPAFKRCKALFWADLLMCFRCNYKKTKYLEFVWKLRNRKWWSATNVEVLRPLAVHVITQFLYSDHDHKEGARSLMWCCVVVLNAADDGWGSVAQREWDKSGRGLIHRWCFKAFDEIYRREQKQKISSFIF